jgi:hypothetical protein
VSRGGMLTELYGDCLLLLGFLREADTLGDRREDIASEIALGIWVEENERLIWVDV